MKLAEAIGDGHNLSGMAYRKDEDCVYVAKGRIDATGELRLKSVATSEDGEWWRVEEQPTENDLVADDWLPFEEEVQ